VFDISQTDGQELPEIGNVTAILANTATGSVNSSLSKAFFSNTRRTSPLLRGTSAGGKITLLPGTGSCRKTSHTAHEVAHELMHRDERPPALQSVAARPKAEAVAFVVCQAIGLRLAGSPRLHPTL